jgi:pimeloyl-ACP methyl ester carboxylesterase
MNVWSGRTHSAFRFWRVVRRYWHHPLGAVTLVGALGLSVSGGSVQATFAVHPTGSPRDHVYLFRGFMPIFPSGLRVIATVLQRQGISATVHYQSDWPEVAENIAARYKKGRLRNIVLVGYSVGAASMTNMAARLDERRVPVRLAVSLDPVWPITATGHVDRYVNYYSSNSGYSVNRGKHFRGSVRNFDVRGIPGINHLNLDNNQFVRRKVIQDILGVLHADDRGELPGKLLVSGIGKTSSR